jgi:rhomboid protease GluP
LLELGNSVSRETPRLLAHRLLVERTVDASVTRWLLLLNITVFTAMALSGVAVFRPDAAEMVAWGANVGALTANGEWWRLVTHQFVHAGVAHLILNLLVLAMFGPVAERLMGAAAFTGLYLACGLVAGATSLAVHPDLVSVGSSGAIVGIYGVLLGLMVVPPAGGMEVAPAIPRRVLARVYALPLIVSLIALLGLGVFDPNVDNAAHLGGVIAGVVSGAALGRRIQWRPIAAAGVAAALGVAVLVCIAAVRLAASATP